MENNTIRYGRNPSAAHYVQSDDAKIYYEVYGEGDPIILLHGGMFGSPEEYAQLAADLLNEHRIILIATRGHAQSEIGYSLPTYEKKAEDVKAVMDDMNLAKAGFIGFSDGAYTAYSFIRKYPDMVRFIVSMGAGIWKNGFVQGGRKDLHSFSDCIELAPEMWKDQLENVRPEPERAEEWFESMLEAFAETKFEKDVFENIHVPVLMIVGEKDANAPMDSVIEACRCMNHAQLGVVPNAPHTILMSDYPVVREMILKFLSER